MARTSKQQRIDPDAVDRGVAARKAEAVTPKKGRPTPKRPRTRPSDEIRREQPQQKPRSGAPDRARKAGPRDWIQGARPQTLALAIAPVALGTGSAASYMDEWYAHWVRALLCLVVAFALQIGVNFANDYSDGIRGTDAQRSGPRRLVGSGAAKASTVRAVAFAFFGIAGAAGIALTIATGHWWLLAVGAVCIVAAWFYTGGKRPYGYAALGEVAVFVFFGLVATVGTTFVQAGTWTFESLVTGAAAGFFACAVLMSNNLRDREKDAAVGKRTLAVVIGSLPSRILYAVFMLAPFGLLVLLMPLYFNVAFVLFALVAAAPAVVIALTGRTASEMLIVLRLSVLTALVYGLAVGALLAL